MTVRNIVPTIASEPESEESSTDQFRQDEFTDKGSGSAESASNKSSAPETVSIGTESSETDTEALLQNLLEQTQADLEPTSPAQALQLYLKDKARDCQDATVAAHRSRLGFFVEWCTDQDIDSLTELSARDLHEFRVWRRQDLNTVSEKTQMDTLRVFIRWCESIDAVKPDLYRKVNSPDLDPDENARETVLQTERTQEVLEYLDTYEYATVDHICWLVLTETGMRLGGVRALDCRDYHPDADVPHFDVRHRPDADTPIKNKHRGERRIGISPEACERIDDYLAHQRPDVTDEYGRDPLLATPHGRVARSTVRTYVYRWSRPCAIDAPCPHDREPSECEAVTDRDRAARCPSSVTPHPIRRGYITQLLRTGVPVDVVSDRCNVSPAIIDKHYDVRSEEDKMRQRQHVLDDVQKSVSLDS